MDSPVTYKHWAERGAANSNCYSGVSIIQSTPSGDRTRSAGFKGPRRDDAPERVFHNKSKSVLRESNPPI